MGPRRRTVRWAREPAGRQSQAAVARSWPRRDRFISWTLARSGGVLAPAAVQGMGDGGAVRLELGAGKGVTAFDESKLLVQALPCSDGVVYRHRLGSFRGIGLDWASSRYWLSRMRLSE